MKTSIEINKQLLSDAKKITGIDDSKTVIERALQLLTANSSQKELLELWGKVEVDEEPYK